MDCEKFENLLMDELYGELDEVTSAAVRRHAAGCARCGALLSGLRATRKVAALPVEEPSSDLEDRILSAVREQQKVLPFRARFAMGLSRAGAWAMRPQTAMAAVFLVVIGTSFVLVTNRKAAPLASRNSEGAPVTAQAAAAPSASAYAIDGTEAAFAHGVDEKKLRAPDTLAMGPSPSATSAALGADLEKNSAFGGAPGHIANAAPVAGTGMLAQDHSSDPWSAKASAGGGAPVAQTTPQATGAPPSFGAAKQAYDARRYDDALSQWDRLAPSDANASLWAGRAEKAKNGCSQGAIQRFESARARAQGGSSVANDATLEAAHCYIAIGSTDLARARLSSLLDQPGYAPQAQDELARLAPAAARKAEMRHASPARATTAAPAATIDSAAAHSY